MVSAYACVVCAAGGLGSRGGAMSSHTAGSAPASIGRLRTPSCTLRLPFASPPTPHVLSALLHVAVHA